MQGISSFEILLIGQNSISSKCFFSIHNLIPPQKGKYANLDSLDKNQFVFHQLFVYKYIS
jgi:hypothetical protein